MILCEAHTSLFVGYRVEMHVMETCLIQLLIIIMHLYLIGMQ